MRRLATLALGVALLSGCGGSGAGGVLGDTGANVGKIRSGDLTVKLLVTPRKQPATPFGFAMRGPVRLRPGHLPVARLEYEQFANGHTATATLVSDGKTAYVETPAGRQPLPASAVQSLARAGGTGSNGIALQDWVRDPHVVSSRGDTETIAGTLDVVKTANGLLEAAQVGGANVRTLSGDDAKRLQDGVRSSRVVVVTGKRDHLLRRLTVHVDFAFTVPPSLHAALGPLVGAKVDLLVGIANPRT